MGRETAANLGIGEETHSIELRSWEHKRKCSHNSGASGDVPLRCLQEEARCLRRESSKLAVVGHSDELDLFGALAKVNDDLKLLEEIVLLTVEEFHGRKERPFSKGRCKGKDMHENMGNKKRKDVAIIEMK